MNLSLTLFVPPHQYICTIKTVFFKALYEHIFHELNILIYTRPEMKSTFHHTLITLACVDTLFIITIIIDIQRFDLNLDNQLFILFFPYFWNPFKNILMTFETYLMMSISTERYMAIRRPIEYRVRKV